MSEDKNGQQRPLDRYMCQQYILNNAIGSPPEHMLQQVCVNLINGHESE